jgi:uncharacterized protein
MRAFVWFLSLLALALAAVAVFTYPAWQLLHPYFDFPFHRIGERIGMLALLVGFVLVARRLKLADRASLGYGLARPAFIREMLIALALGVASMLAVLGIMVVLGLLEWRPGAATSTVAALARVIARGLLTGFAVAFIEETFLRGAMHTAIERESGTRTAVLLTAVLYSATHFFATYHIPAGQVSAHSGLDLLSGTLRAFAQPAAILDAFLALFAVGVVLALVRSATGNIAACIGLHAGWVWVIQVAHDLTQPQRAAPWSFLVSRFDGFVGWLTLGWTVLLGYPMWRFYRTRSQKRRSGAAASTSL